MAADQATHPAGDARKAEMARLWLHALPVLESYIRGMVFDADAREDVLQATAEQMLLSFDEYDADRPFTPWILGVARYRLLAHFRTKQREKLRFGDEMLEVLAYAAEEIEGELDDRMAALEKCMGKLEPKHRKLIRLRYVEEHKTATIAEQMRARPNAVSAMLRRVRMALASCVEKQLKAGEAQA